MTGLPGLVIALLCVVIGVLSLWASHRVTQWWRVNWGIPAKRYKAIASRRINIGLMQALLVDNVERDEVSCGLILFLEVQNSAHPTPLLDWEVDLRLDSDPLDFPADYQGYPFDQIVRLRLPPEPEQEREWIEIQPPDWIVNKTATEVPRGKTYGAMAFIMKGRVQSDLVGRTLTVRMSARDGDDWPAEMYHETVLTNYPYPNAMPGFYFGNSHLEKGISYRDYLGGKKEDG